jgi:hypothetical protein
MMECASGTALAYLRSSVSKGLSEPAVDRRK